MTESGETITPALEDYLETIYLLVRDKKLARVRDIADRRAVKPGSVVPALRRLSAMGYIRYEQREFIDITPAGEAIARRTLARHELLRRFFEEILQISPENASEDACSMEHYLSDEGMEKLGNFFQFLERCPRGRTDFMERFHRCPVANPDRPACTEKNGCKERARGGGDGRGDR